jgi:hypothetical protein
MPRKTMKKTQTKASFVRSLPSNTPAKEVVSKAKTAGLSFDERYVYKVRAMAKAGKHKPLGRRPGRPAKLAVAAPAAAETLLRAVAAELGIGRALAILEDQHRQVRRVLGG